MVMEILKAGEGYNTTEVVDVITKRGIRCLGNHVCQVTKVQTMVMCDQGMRTPNHFLLTRGGGNLSVIDIAGPVQHTYAERFMTPATSSEEAGEA